MWITQEPQSFPVFHVMHFLLKIWFIKGKMLFNKDEWAKIPPQRCKTLIVSYRKVLIAVLASKSGTTSF